MPVEDENAALDDDSFRPHRRSELERDEAWDAEAKASEDAGELTVVRAKDGVHLVATVSSERARGRGRAARGGHRIGDRGAPRILRSIRRVPRPSRARCHHVRLSRHRRLPAGCEEADDARLGQKDLAGVRFYENASIERVHVTRAEVGRAIGHFGFFRGRFRAGLWDHAARFLSRRGARGHDGGLEEEAAEKPCSVTACRATWPSRSGSQDTASPISSSTAASR